MAWIALIVCGLVLWGATVILLEFGRRIWPLDMARVVEVVTAPALSAVATTAHRILAPGFSPLVRAAVLVAIVIALDALIVAPFIERSAAIFRSPALTWLPFALIFLRAG